MQLSQYYATIIVAACLVASTYAHAARIRGAREGTFDEASASRGLLDSRRLTATSCAPSVVSPDTTGWGWFQFTVTVDIPSDTDMTDPKFELTLDTSSSSRSVGINACWGDAWELAVHDDVVIVSRPTSSSHLSAGTTARVSCGASGPAHTGVSIAVVNVKAGNAICGSASAPSSNSGAPSSSGVTDSVSDTGNTDSQDNENVNSSGSGSGSGSGAASPPSVVEHACPPGFTGTRCLSPDGHCGNHFFQCVSGYAYALQHVAAGTQCLDGATVHEFLCPSTPTEGVPSSDSSDSAGEAGSAQGSTQGSTDSSASSAGGSAPGSTPGETSNTGDDTSSSSGSSGSGQANGSASAGDNSSGSADDTTPPHSGNGGIAYPASCDDGQGDGVRCWPNDCCAEFFQCAGSVAYPPQLAAPGTVCYQGSLIAATAPQCADVVCSGPESPGGEPNQNPAPEEPLCGDGRCAATEDCASCAADCGVCSAPEACGDGICNAAETCASCAVDCGPCGTPPAPSSGIEDANSGTGSSSDSGNGASPVDTDTPSSGGSRNNNKKLVGWYTNWSQYRSPNGGAFKFFPENVDATLLTHAAFAFAKVSDGPAYEVQAYEWNDIIDWAPQTGMYARFNRELHAQNPNIKTMLSVGGWNFNARGTTAHIFTTMAASPAGRANFIASAISFTRQHGFDGFDCDWEYPAHVGQGGRPEDKANFATLLREFRVAIEAEAVQSGRPALLLAVAVSAGESTINAGYDIPSVSASVDYIGLMSYDLHGAWESHTGAHTALYPPSGAAPGTDDALLTVDHAVGVWLAGGCPADKIVLGLASYGRTFTLTSEAAALAPHAKAKTGMAASGAGLAGTYTREGGFLSYYEIEALVAAGATTVYDSDTHTQVAVLGDQWVGYDTQATLTEKVDYLHTRDLGGAMLWALDLDDFRGGRYPLTQTIAQRLFAPTGDTLAVEMHIGSAGSSSGAARTLSVVDTSTSAAAVGETARTHLSEALGVPPTVFRVRDVTTGEDSGALTLHLQVVETRAVPAAEVERRIFQAAKSESATVVVSAEFEGASVASTTSTSGAEATNNHDQAPTLPKRSEPEPPSEWSGPTLAVAIVAATSVVVVPIAVVAIAVRRRARQRARDAASVAVPPVLVASRSAAATATTVSVWAKQPTHMSNAQASGVTPARAPQLATVDHAQGMTAGTRVPPAGGDSAASACHTEVWMDVDLSSAESK